MIPILRINFHFPFDGPTWFQKLLTRNKRVTEADQFFFKMEPFWMDIERKFFRKTTQSGNPQGCINWIGYRKGGNGYGVQVVKWPGGDEKREAAHRLAYMIRHRITRYDMPTVDENSNNIECSHICLNNACVNSDHIVLEPHAINQERIHCKLQGHCSKCHKPYCLLCIYLFTNHFLTEILFRRESLAYGCSECFDLRSSLARTSRRSIFFS